MLLEGHQQIVDGSRPVGHRSDQAHAIASGKLRLRQGLRQTDHGKKGLSFREIRQARNSCFLGSPARAVKSMDRTLKPSVPEIVLSQLRPGGRRVDGAYPKQPLWLEQVPQGFGGHAGPGVLDRQAHQAFC